jgi:hypothetical protein
MVDVGGALITRSSDRVPHFISHNKVSFGAWAFFVALGKLQGRECKNHHCGERVFGHLDLALEPPHVGCSVVQPRDNEDPLVPRPRTTAIIRVHYKHLGNPIVPADSDVHPVVQLVNRRIRINMLPILAALWVFQLAAFSSHCSLQRVLGDFNRFSYKSQY